MEYLALEGGPPTFTRSSTASVLLTRHQCALPVVAYGTITLYRVTFQTLRLTDSTLEVRASPLSLAATNGVSVDFLSYRYLDVSVPCVRSRRPIHSAAGDAISLHCDDGLPHSEIPGSKLV